MTRPAAYTSPNIYSTDCLHCGEAFTQDAYNGDAHRRWATTHARDFPGHQVHVERSATRSYQVVTPSRSG